MGLVKREDRMLAEEYAKGKRVLAESYSRLLDSMGKGPLATSKPTSRIQRENELTAFLSIPFSYLLIIKYLISLIQINLAISFVHLSSRTSVP